MAWGPNREFPVSSEPREAASEASARGHYLLRSNPAQQSPAKLWQFCIQPTEVEQAFKELKSDLAIRPI